MIETWVEGKKRIGKIMTIMFFCRNLNCRWVPLILTAALGAQQAPGPAGPGTVGPPTLQALPGGQPSSPVVAADPGAVAPDTVVPTAKDVLSSPAIDQSPSSELAWDRAQEKDREAVVRKLKDAYKGPFILASDLFGHPLSHRRGARASVSDDYRLGTGDKMLLYVFGSATFEVPLEVDRSGQAFIPKVGSVHLVGLSLGEARLELQRLVSSQFSRSRVELQFMKTRDVRIFILGEVYLPGAYVVPSLTSLLDALSMSGGPSPVGSLRNIQLVRGNKVVLTQDLYDLRLKGRGMENLLLQDGDTIFVPLAGTQVLMDGAFVRVGTSPVNRETPGVVVELKQGDSAWEAVQCIGGLTPSADLHLLTLRRTESDGRVRVFNIQYVPDAMKNQKLFPGDRLSALTRAEWLDDLVEVKGHAKVPGVFAFHPGMKVSQLLMGPDQVLPDTYMGRGEILRTLDDQTTRLITFDVAKALRHEPSDDLPLSPRDSVTLFKVEALRLKRTLSVLGPFSHPGTFDWHEGMRASDLIFLAGVPQLNADRNYAELAHFSEKGQPMGVERLDLAKLIYTDKTVPSGLRDAKLNPPLRPYDQITLFEIPDFKVHRTVVISGQVRRPGPYVFTTRKFTLSQLIQRAGGLTAEAMPQGTIFLRNALQSRDLSKEDLQKSGLREADPTGQGLNEILQRLSETKRTKETGALLQSPVMHGLIAGSLNRMVVDFRAAMSGDARHDVELRDGDQVIIPRATASAYVVGEVASPFSSFQVQDGDTVRDLVRLSGGFTRNADQGQVRLLKADGRVIDEWVMSKKVEAGDAVLIPQRFRTNTTWQDNLQALTPIALLLNAINF